MDISKIDQSDRIYIPVNCNESWDAMPGDDKVRFCGKCCHNVYNLVGMSYAEQRAVVADKANLPCMRAYLRPDRTVVFDRCPVVLRPLRDKVKRSFAMSVLLVSTWCHNVVAWANGEPIKVTPECTQEGTGFGGPMLDPGSATTRAVPTFSEIDLAVSTKDNRTPSLIYESNGMSGRWRLRVYTPLLWMDGGGYLREAKCGAGEWRTWIDAIAPQIIERWQAVPSSAKKVVVEITLRDQPPDNGITFVSQKDEQLQSISKILGDLTGLSKGKRLVDILPLKAKNAEYVLLKMSFEKLEK